MSRIRRVVVTEAAGSPGMQVCRRMLVTVTESARTGGFGEMREPKQFRVVPREEGPAARWLRAERGQAI